MSSMTALRLLSTLLVCASLLCARSAAQPPNTTAPITTIRLSADHVELYFDRYLIEADGNVRVTTSDGLVITGDAFSMDLKLNRFLVAGSVHLVGATGSQSGAAVADFLDFNRLYFVPVTGEPDRWTFLNGDYAHPIKGREMPGDTFFFPDLSDTTPFLHATSAVIGTKNYARFGGAVLMVGSASVAPTGSYYMNFSPNQHLAQNSLSGANLDATTNVAGNANSISAVHLRYDSVNKTYASFEQHVSNDKFYAVFSLNPATEPSKFWNLVTGYEPSNKFEIYDFSQLHTYQYGLQQPLQVQEVSNITATEGFPESSISLNYELVHYSLLGQPPSPPGYYGTVPDLGAWIPQHPQYWTLGVSSFTHNLGHSQVQFRYRYGAGLIHDAFGLQTLGGVTYTTINDHYIGATLYSSALKLGDLEDPRKTFYFNFSLDGQRSWYSVPHHVDTIDGQGSVSRIFGTRLASYLAYEVMQTGDYYNAGQQSAYPSYTPVIGSTVYPSYASFQGISTLRTLSLGINFTPDPDFNFSILARKHKDFPIPEPGLFQLPLTNVLGQFQTTTFLGQPPYDVSAELRVRIAPHWLLDIQRTYYYGLPGVNPGYVIQVLP